MARDTNYNDLAKTKTATQLKKAAQVAKLLSDIQRIDLVVVDGHFDQLKSLHVELDGTYQNQIKNWGTSMYNYFKGMGFSYEYVDSDTLRENLTTMKGKLQGLLFEIEPSAVIPAEHMTNTQTAERYHMTTTQKKLLADYAKIKQSCSGNMAIMIQDADYPKFKNTLDYLVEYEYVRPLNIDGTGHMYIKEPAFDSFTEHILSQEMEENAMTLEYSNKKVFLVHGHDHQLLDEVELMIRRIGLEPVIVKNEANSGRTIIEKIEDLTDVGFGIVLYTSCDEGRKKGTPTLQDRARQNVIFEHGYLYAKLGRGRVAALNDSRIEVPSDLAGVLYIPRSAADWKQQLMREMKAAGLEFDSTRA